MWPFKKRAMEPMEPAEPDMTGMQIWKDGALSGWRVGYDAGMTEGYLAGVDAERGRLRGTMAALEAKMGISKEHLDASEER